MIHNSDDTVTEGDLYWLISLKDEAVSSWMPKPRATELYDRWRRRQKDQRKLEVVISFSTPSSLFRNAQAHLAPGPKLASTSGRNVFCSPHFSVPHLQMVSERPKDLCALQYSAKCCNLPAQSLVAIHGGGQQIFRWKNKPAIHWPWHCHFFSPTKPPPNLQKKGPVTVLRKSIETQWAVLLFEASTCPSQLRVKEEVCVSSVDSEDWWFKPLWPNLIGSFLICHLMVVRWLQLQ